MYLPLNTAIAHAEKLKSSLFADHISRQTKIWELTIKPKPKKETTPILNKKETPKLNFILGNPKIPKYDCGEPISLEKPLHFILGDTSSMESSSSYHSFNNNPLLHENDYAKSEKEPEECKMEESHATTMAPNFKIGGPTSVLLTTSFENFKTNSSHSKKDVETLQNERKTVSLVNGQNRNDNSSFSNKMKERIPLSYHPNFKIGAPAADLIKDNKMLRYE